MCGSPCVQSDDIPATVDGVLGGFGDLSDPDVKETKAFLEKYVFKVSPVTKLPLSLGKRGYAASAATHQHLYG